jgi:uncharacterized NAD-dependent epimerase/dehydratase family protein
MPSAGPASDDPGTGAGALRGAKYQVLSQRSSFKKTTAWARQPDVEIVVHTSMGDSKAQAEQVRSVAVERIGALVGVVPPELLAALDEALRLHLTL